MTYTLTAEQMQQVREKVSAAQTTAFERWGGSSGELPQDPRNMNDRDANDFCIRNGADGFDAAVIYWHTADALALLDAAMQAPEATEPKDYADLKKLRRLACKAWRHDLTRQQALDALKNLQNAAQDSYGEHMTDALESPEAPAQTGSEDGQEGHGGCHQCGGGPTVRYKVEQQGVWVDCQEPIHGTKPEAPTELCKVCGEWRYATPHLNFRRLGTDHPFTPTDATPEDEDTGR